MARVKLSIEFADSVKEALVRHHNESNRKSDGKIHVGDLLAPRFAYYQIKNGRVMRPEDVDMFIPGTAFHELLQKAMGQEYAEKAVELENIVGHIDFLKTFVVEIKTSRKYTIPEFPEEHYLAQCKYYMVMADVRLGYIVVIYFTAGRNPWKKKASTLEVVAWSVEITDEEANDVYNEMLDIKENLEKAISESNPSLIPICKETWRCLQIYKNEVTKICPYYEECKPSGRYPLDIGIKVCAKKKGK